MVSSIQLYLLCRPRMLSGSSVILSALAVADTLTLLIGPTFVYVKEIHGINIEQKYLFICKTNRYLKSVFGYIANWLVMVFTIFRVIAVYWPHKVSVYCTRKRAYFAVSVTCVLSIIANLDSLIFSQHIQQNTTERDKSLPINVGSKGRAIFITNITTSGFFWSPCPLYLS